MKIIYVEAPDYIETCKGRREGQIPINGAMILDDYDCYDSCIKFMDELIEKYNGLV